VYGVFDPNFGHFLNLPSGSKVIWRFKAKKEAFRERFCENVKILPLTTILNWELAVEMKPAF